MAEEKKITREELDEKYSFTKKMDKLDLNDLTSFIIISMVKMTQRRKNENDKSYLTEGFGGFIHYITHLEEKQK